MMYHLATAVAHADTTYSTGVTTTTTDMASVVFALGFFVAIMVLGIVFFFLWISALVHLLKHDVKDKVVWVLLLLFVPPIGALLYHIVVKRAIKQLQHKK